MKSYLIDEIASEDIKNIVEYLKKNGSTSGMENLFWIEVPDNYLNDLQAAHSKCAPHQFAVETGDSWIKTEFFIRTSKKFRCDCNGYCDAGQRKFIIEYMDAVIDKLNIRT